MNKGVIFWAIWVLVMAGAGGFYFFVVAPMEAENDKKAALRKGLAARIVNDSELTKKIKNSGAKKAKDQNASAEDGVVFIDEDPLLFSLYPLKDNSSKIPNPAKRDAARNQDAALANKRASFVKFFETVQFKVDREKDKDFIAPPPSDRDAFRQWVVKQEPERIDKEFRDTVERLTEEDNKALAKAWEESKAKAGGKEIGAMKPAAPCAIMTCETQRNMDSGMVTWLADGTCSGRVEKGSPEGNQVVDHLVLRRLILKALARTKAIVPTNLPAKYPNTIVRRVQAIDRLSFLDGDQAQKDQSRNFVALRNMRLGNMRPSVKEKLPYRPNGFELSIKCHVAVLPEVIRELEAIGQEADRPFTCWVERVVVKRQSGKPGDGTAGNPGPEVKGADYGDWGFEWAVSAELLVVVPEFDEAIDPAP